MRHYELVFLVHPDKSSNIKDIIKEYTDEVTQGNGKVHRCENAGSRVLSYMIASSYKAYYVVMNIECDLATLESIKNKIKFNEAIMRSLVTKCNTAITKASPLVSSAKSDDKKIDDKKSTAKS